MIDAVLRACAWIETRLGDLAIDRSLDPSRRMAALKAFGDLAHAADILERSAQPALAAIGQRWMELAVRQLAGGERIRELIAAAPIYAPAAVMFLPLHLSGRPCPALYATLAAQIRGAELPPLAWTMLVPSLELYDIEPTAVMRAQARRMSVLAAGTAAALLPQDAAYVLVHECMYATRWGRCPPRWDRDTSAYVAQTLPELIERRTADRDADLVAELILAAHAALGACAAPRAWDALLAAQTPAGNVEPLARLVTMFPRLPHPVLTRTYHTTLVSIMAWTACGHHDAGIN